MSMTLRWRAFGTWSRVRIDFVRRPGGMLSTRPEMGWGKVDEGESEGESKEIIGGGSGCDVLERSRQSRGSRILRRGTKE